ncbi:MAG TPA: hypothetical protein VMT15_00860 [Bryobacteraceae bacterium]|nr:hypothetical protein [Bryobacteraceae bacterium]
MLTRLSFALLMVGTNSVWAQQVISAHSGVIHYVEGQVTLDGKTVAPKFAEFPDVKNGSTLAAEDGRAEVLLTPGVILRIGENSSFKMISNSRSDTVLSILSGAAIVEVGELLPSNAITLVYNDTRVALVKRGLYRLDADEAGKFRVYEGEARVTDGSQTLVARKGRQVQLGAVLDMSSFDAKDTDELTRWASRRSEYLAQANVSSARTASGSSQSYLGGIYGSAYGYGGAWAYNPWFGMFTYLPFGNGMYYSPFFGYPYYSPYNVGYAMPIGTGSLSAFPISNSTTSPHFNGGAGGFTPRPSSPASRGEYGGLGTAGATRASSSGLGTAGATGVSSGGGGFSGGGARGGGGMSGGSATGGRGR